MAELINKLDSLNTGREKINQSIQDAEDAKTIASDADTKAEQAISNSENTQTQLDNIVIEGDSSVEAAQARYNSVTDTNHDTLVDRLDTDYGNVTSQLAETTQDYIKLSKQQEGGTSDKDNHQLLLNLITKAKQQGKGLYVPNGQYYVSDDIVIENIFNILIDGEIIMAEGKKLEIVGGRGAHSYNISIRKVTGKLRLRGFFNSYLKIMGATELELYANGDLDYWHHAMAYNEITLGRIEKFRIFSEGTVEGWINENTFYGGRIFNLFIDGNYQHNHNIFYNPKIENGTIEINRGSQNRLYDVRLEGENTITFGSNAHSNKVFNSWNGNSAGPAFSLSSPKYTDNGVGNEVIGASRMELESVELMNINSERFNMELFDKNEEKLSAVASYQNIYGSGIHEIDKNFGINVESDQPLFRIRVTLYDENKNKIRDDNAIEGSALDYYSSNEYFGTRFNLDRLYVAIKKGYDAKYFSVDVITGDSTDGILFKGVRISVTTKKSENSSNLVDEARIQNRMISNRLPTSTDFRRGKVVYHGAPLAGRAFGWVYDGSGNWLEISTMTE